MILSLLLLLLLAGIIHLFIKLLNPLYNNKIYLYIRISVLMGLGTALTVLAQFVLNSLVLSLRRNILALKMVNAQDEADSLSVYSKAYCIKQIHRLKIVIHLFYFTICYTGAKTVFFFLLNEDLPTYFRQDGLYRFSLFKADTFVWYSSQNVFESSFLVYTELFEYTFRILFGFFLPIYFIMKLLKNECKGVIHIPKSDRDTEIEDSLSKSRSDEVMDPIYGLGFS